MRFFVTQKQAEDEKRFWEEKGFRRGVRYNTDALIDQIDLAYKEGYTKGKADGIAIAKQAAAVALKQTGEQDNDILRQHQGR